MIKKTFLIDPNVKGSMSETFDKSQMSETIDVPAGCSMSYESVYLKEPTNVCEGFS